MEPLTPTGAPTPEVAVQTAGEFTFGMRVAVAAIAAAILLSGGVFRHLHDYRALWVQLAVFATLLAITAVEAALNLRRRSWGRARWCALGIALVASAASTWSLPTGGVGQSVDWAYGAICWVGVIVLVDQPVAWLAAFLAVHAGMTTVALLLSHPDASYVLSFVSTSVGVIGFPLACGLGVETLRRVARTADNSRREAEEIRTRETVKAELDRVRQERFLDLSHTAGPLLRDLAEGRLDLEDPAVQRDCWIEATRMRRLFAEADEVDSPLLHELQQCVDGANRRGIRADLDAHGELPAAPVEIRRALTDFAVAVLALARSEAQITALVTAGEVSLSLVIDLADTVDLATDETAARLAVPAGLPIEVQPLVEDEGRLWMEALWSTGPSPR
jgi:hypothetical protein